MKLNTKIAIGLMIIVAFALVMLAIQAIYAPPPVVLADLPKVASLNETFDKSDFTYTTSGWKPYGTKSLPIVSGHDPNGDENYSIMFVDLYATPFGIDSLSNYTGGIKVEYDFTGLTGLAAFNIYGFAMHSNNLGTTPGVFMTNRASYPAAAADSGFYVTGASTLAGTVPQAQALSLNMLHINVANDEGPAFNVYNNSTYSITFIQPGGGLNALHFTVDAGSNKRSDFGSVTYTSNQSGIFYVSDTGGAGISDVILMVAVNGTVPDSFRLHLTASMADNRSVFE